MSYSREKEVAIEAVSLAAALCAQVRAEMVGAQSLEKDDKSPVTVADFGSQALICRCLSAAFPGDAIVAEEDAADLQKPENSGRLAQVVDYVRRFEAGSTAAAVCEWIDAGRNSVAGRYWTLDPIDGTKGFLRNDQYAIALALVENGDVKVAALACPALPLDGGLSTAGDGSTQAGTLFVAVRGAGAFMASLGGDNFRPIRVAQDGNSAASRFVESVEAGHGDQSLQESIARAAGITQPALRMDSQAKYGAVARGDAVLYLRLPSPKSPDYREKIWDHAAGALVVEAAGGRVTDMNGQALDFAGDRQMRHNRGVVVSNGPLHEAVLAALAGA
ncbi:MAG TPA: 3'(2'),5'-bisphosphate nucleotidase [Abditibacteriaceae bacterium]|nr:3'(2'),5'-bisphosphate nucleotidase [Abditibacteriaceae bacterium]